MTQPIPRDAIYKRRVFDAQVIELCVRWSRLPTLRSSAGSSDMCRSTRHAGADSRDRSEPPGGRMRRTWPSAAAGITSTAPSTSTVRQSTSSCVETAGLQPRRHSFARRSLRSPHACRETSHSHFTRRGSADAPEPGRVSTTSDGGPRVLAAARKLRHGLSRKRSC